MRRPYSIGVAAVLALLASDALATNVPGGTIVNQTWTEAGNPYVIQGDIIVPSGSFLHIQPGTVVHIASSDMQLSGIDTSRVEITVQGEIEVNGTQADPVAILAQTGNSPYTWYGLIVDSGASKASFQWMTFQHASYGLRSHAPAAVLSIETSRFFQNYNQGVELHNGAGVFDRVHIHDNNSYGVRVQGGSAVMTNLLAVDNGSAAVYVTNASNVSLYNGTIYSNSSHAVYAAGTSSVNVVNSILTNNSGYGAYRSGSSSISVSHSNVWSNNSGSFYGFITESNNLSANPQYVNPPQDLSLQSTSVCIDTGTAQNAPGHDFDNVIRPLNGDGLNGAEFDMGAFEYVAMPTCGDGSLDGGEACDDGAANGSYGHCDQSCTGPGPHCGDNVINGPEQCDDGGTTSGDGCDAGCMLESSGSGGAGGNGSGAGGNSSGAGGNGSGGNGSGAGGDSSGAGGDASMGGQGSEACVPGAQVACACPGGEQGVQQCNDDGNGFGSCSCAGGSSDNAGDSEDSGGCSHRGGTPGGNAWLLALALGALSLRRRRAAR